MPSFIVRNGKFDSMDVSVLCYDRKFKVRNA